MLSMTQNLKVTLAKVQPKKKHRCKSLWKFHLAICCHIGLNMYLPKLKNSTDLFVILPMRGYEF